MFPKILFLWLSVALLTCLHAADLKVNEIVQLTNPEDGRFNGPKISPDATFIVFSGDQYKGLYRYELDSGKITRLTDAAGAGYEFYFSSDGTSIIFRSHQYKGIKRYFSLNRLNLSDNSREIIESDVRNLSVPLRSPSGGIFYKKDDSQSVISSTGNAKQTAEKVVRIKNRNIVLTNAGREEILNPFGKGIYIWPSLSPGGERLLFTEASKGTFISDLSGNIIKEIGFANAPVWSPDGKWIVFMRDIDDGHQYLESEIHVMSVENGYTIQITDTADIIEMYPSWGQDNRMIVFSSLEGQIYLARLQEIQ